MALSKTFLLLGLALALVLLISSEVSSARELAEATHARKFYYLVYVPNHNLDLLKFRKVIKLYDLIV